MSRLSLILGFVGLAFVGCGGPPEDVPPDAASMGDAAESIADAAIDLDRDRDGVTNDLDCAPDDPAVTATGTRPCSSPCGEGTQACFDGEWRTCSVGEDCLCEEPSAVRVGECARCGMQRQVCSATLRWTPEGECIPGGPCEVGDIEEERGTFCTRATRICGNDCQWGDWTSAGMGECEPGLWSCDSSSDRLCDETCHWIDNPDCNL